MRREYLAALGIFLVVGIALFALLAYFVGSYSPTSAAPIGTDLDAATLQVAKGLYCPICPGVPLDVCETVACQQWRALIREKLAAGENPTQIEAYFVQQYGERVHGAPKPEGLNLLIYALPAFVVSGGAALFYLFAVSRTRAAPASQSLPLEDEYRKRIQQELTEHD